MRLRYLRCWLWGRVGGRVIVLLRGLDFLSVGLRRLVLHLVIGVVGGCGIRRLRSC